MNLEDDIRASARNQANRYRPSGDIVPRIEQRRRQRSARRITAAGLGIAVVMGGAVVATTGGLGERDREIPVAEPVADTRSDEASVVESIATAPATTTTESTPTTSIASTTAAVPSMSPPSTQPAGNAPEQPATPGNDPVVTQPNDVGVAMPRANADGSVWTYGEFWNVPQMGSEPVRGSGCGSTGGIGAVIPDGLWAGFITGANNGPPAVVSIDLVCVFSGDQAQRVLTDASSNVVLSEPDYVVVNNSTNGRTMPMGDAIVLRLGSSTADGRCVEDSSTQSWSDVAPNQQAWIRIHGGAVTWVFAGCA